MKGSRLIKWISITLSAMLVFMLFPVQALAGGSGNMRNDPTDAVDIFTVTFVDWDGSFIRSVLVERGKDANPPKHPEREGYVAAGWSPDYTNVQENLTVTAVYEPIEEEEPSTFFGALLFGKPKPTASPTPTPTYAYPTYTYPYAYNAYAYAYSCTLHYHGEILPRRTAANVSLPIP